MNTSSSSPAWNSFRRVYWTIAVVMALLLLLLWLMGFGPGGRVCKIPGAASSSAASSSAASSSAAPAVAAAPTVVAAPASAPASAPEAAPAPVAAAAPAAPVAAAAPPPAAKLYFPLDKITLPQNTVTALLPIVNYLKANEGAKASVSGFHDPTGSRARNEELALNRARAVRGALERAGIARERIVMQKPAATTGSGPAAEARRVEVSVQMP